MVRLLLLFETDGAAAVDVAVRKVDDDATAVAKITAIDVIGVVITGDGAMVQFVHLLQLLVLATVSALKTKSLGEAGTLMLLVTLGEMRQEVIAPSPHLPDE